ncbi:MAG: YifB family Mg chelatase-like AAA ATPase, partial [Acidobacteriota bacterium]
MLASTVTGAILGIEGYLVRVEVDVSGGVPCFRTVGLPDAAVREARERVRSALRNSGFTFPDRRITINLAPADVRKHGSAFDLAFAVGLMASGEEVPVGLLAHTLLLGELALDGGVRPVRGVLPVAAEAKRRGIEAVVVPAENGPEAALVEGLAVYPVRSLREAADLLRGEELPQARNPQAAPQLAKELPDLCEVKGQYRARRALEVAAAGGHNLLLSGPPGAGKTLLARRLPSILPELTFDEALEVTKVNSVAGKLLRGGGLLSTPPFRAPHHTVSWAAMAGGGPGPTPGEVSLAHRGVLFLDELPEFPRAALEALRQPLEEGSILISRVRCSVLLPARF